MTPDPIEAHRRASSGAFASARTLAEAFLLGAVLFYVGFFLGMLPNVFTSDPQPNGLLFLITAPIGFLIGVGWGVVRGVRRARDVEHAPRPPG